MNMKNKYYSAQKFKTTMIKIFRDNTHAYNENTNDTFMYMYL